MIFRCIHWSPELNAYCASFNVHSPEIKKRGREQGIVQKPQFILDKQNRCSYISPNSAEGCRGLKRPRRDCLGNSLLNSKDY